MDVKGFHIEATNICTLKCAGCPRTQFIRQWPKHWQNHSVNIDHLMKFLDCDLTDKIVSLCGNYGDPIYHPEFIRLVHELKQRKSQIVITTNGSYKTVGWWNELCDRLDTTDSIMFSIDGLPDNFTKYRENADWESIQIGINTCVNRGIKTIWKFIPFAFNDTQIDQARAIATDMGADFLVEFSDRFDSHTEYLRPDTSLLGQRLKFQKQINQGSVVEVDPRCSRGQAHYIAATGHYAPCCNVADHRFYYKTMWGKDMNEYSIQNTTITEILARPKTLEFYQTITSSPHRVCQFNCPKVD